MSTLIRDTRKQNELSQKDFAKILGYSAKQIKQLEKAQKQPSSAHLKLLRMYTCYRNLTTNAGKWRSAQDMQLFTRKVVEILKN